MLVLCVHKLSINFALEITNKLILAQYFMLGLFNKSCSKFASNSEDFLCWNINDFGFITTVLRQNIKRKYPVLCKLKICMSCDF